MRRMSVLGATGGRDIVTGVVWVWCGCGAGARVRSPPAASATRRGPTATATATTATTRTTVCVGFIQEGRLVSAAQKVR